MEDSQIKITDGRVERIDEICSSLAAMSKQENFQDVRMVCQDGEVRGARLVLALAFPHMEEAMEEREEEELVLILPHMQAVDVTNRLEDFLRYLPKVEVKEEFGSDREDIIADENEKEEDSLFVSVPKIEIKEEVWWDLDSEGSAISSSVPDVDTLKPPSKYSPISFGGKSLDAKSKVHRNGLHCEHCAKVFNDTKALKCHLKIHKEKSEICNECGAKFGKKSVLKEHMELKHIRSMDYICDVCDKRFPTGRYLTLHKQRHKIQSIFEKDNF